MRALTGAVLTAPIGIPLLVLAFQTWKGAAILERRRIEFFFGEEIPSPYRPVPKGTLFQRVRAQLFDPAIWRDLLYDFLLFPIGVLELVIVSILFSIIVFLLAAPSYFWATDLNMFGGQCDRYRLADRHLSRSDPGDCVIGAVLLVPFWLIVLAARAHVLLASWMLGASRNEELEERVDVLTKTRSDVMDAMMIERQPNRARPARWRTATARFARDQSWDGEGKRWNGSRRRAGARRQLARRGEAGVGRTA